MFICVTADFADSTDDLGSTQSCPPRAGALACPNRPPPRLVNLFQFLHQILFQILSR